MLSKMVSNGSATPKPVCDRFNYYSPKHSTPLLRGFEGIPQNILANVVCFLILIVTFGILRKKAWNYGRIALVSKQNESMPLRNLANTNSYNVWTALFYGDLEVDYKKKNGSVESLESDTGSQSQGVKSIFPPLFKLTDKDIERKSGTDAIQYLVFQRYIMVFTAIIGLLSVAVILPLNLHGGLKSREYEEFGTTTISNISKDSPFLWIHFIFGLIFLAIMVVVLRHFSVRLHFEQSEHAVRSLMISDIPEDKCYDNFIMQHFREAYPDLHVVHIQFAHDVRKLLKLKALRDTAKECLRNAEEILQRSGERPKLTPSVLGRLCFCIEKVDAIDFYGLEYQKYETTYSVEKQRVEQSNIGLCFVTFESAGEATIVMLDYNPEGKDGHAPRMSSLSGELRSSFWTVRFAPLPEDIVWGNLSSDNFKWWLKAISINLAVILLVCLLTTPTYVLNLLNHLPISKTLSEANSALLEQFLPSLILWIVSATLPFLVYYSDQFVGHWTRTYEHYWVMLKTYIYLILMILVLPSLGLTSLPAFMSWMLAAPQNSSQPSSIQWECVFMPDNGAFFVNYIITSALIGTSLELIRFPELFMYACRMATTRSEAEKSTVKKKVVWEFQYGQSYAWMLCTFAIVCSYSILSPLIVPFGFIYLFLKHLVDRYNIYYAYLPSKIDKSIHELAINCAIVAMLLLQLNIVGFFAMRLSPTHPLNVVTTMCLLITLFLFMCRVGLGWFKGVGPIIYSTDEVSFSPDPKDANQTDDNQDEFLAPVLRPDGYSEESSPVRPSDQIREAPISAQQPANYGTQNESGLLIQ